MERLVSEASPVTMAMLDSIDAWVREWIGKLPADIPEAQRRGLVMAALFSEGAVIMASCANDGAHLLEGIDSASRSIRVVATNAFARMDEEDK